MKKILAVASALLVSGVQAADTPLFGDINYFFKQGELNVLADVNSSVSKIKENGSTFEARGLILQTQYTYGISDQLNAFVGLDYAWDREVENLTTPSNADYGQDGLANPEIGAIYRHMSQNFDRLNVDFGAAARLSIFDAERGSAIGQSSKDGNFADGRSSLELFSRVGKKWNEANEWQIAAGGVFHLDGESEVLSSASNVEVDEGSSLDLFLRGSYQYRPVREFMMLLSAQVNRIGEVEYEGLSDDTHEAHFDLDFKFTAKYLITDNVIGRFIYQISRNADYNVKVTGASNKEIQDRMENFFGLGVDLLF